MYVAISNVRVLVEKGEKSSVFYHWSQLLVSPNARIYGIGGSRHTTSNFVFLFSFQTACAPNETHLFAYIRIPLILVLLSTHKYGVSRVPKSKNTHHPFGVYECASLGLPRSVIVWWSMSWDTLCNRCSILFDSFRACERYVVVVIVASTAISK